MPRGQNIPASEWIIGSLGALLTAAAILYLLNEGLRGDKSPPEFTVSVESFDTSKSGYRVRVRVKNDGGQAAARVRIVGTLRTNGADETAETVLDYVPAKSDRRGGVFFRADPRSGTLDLRVTGYEQP